MGLEIADILEKTTDENRKPKGCEFGDIIS
jgi:hypothetical protein